ncbi:hypothetical protein D1646_17775 [Pseudoflavonifractor sp. 60]|uniref:hypothetical protein n=1 Tax=Pseudoflavonifractor sp. 60 TaxID=2304576 RepID=UPI0013686183|nr:hypothetical protein [Pseudoflavonifractor sp. 60]NBI68594.1 hypothetical protein [Pseudoflavonifractor sp. 60]
MSLLKRTAAAGLALCLLLALAACGEKGLTETDAQVYVKGHLDAAYLGSYDQAYIDLVDDMTQEDAQKMHDQNVEDEADILLEYLTIEDPTDELRKQAQDLVREIYSHSKYTVGSATKTKDGDFAIEVTVSPIEVLTLQTENDFMDALEESGYVDALTDEEIAQADIRLGEILLEQLEGFLPQLSYGKDQIIMLQLKPDEEGYYSLVDTGMLTLDGCIIDYTGEYMN